MAAEERDGGVAFGDPAPVDCSEFPRAPDGTRRQTFDSFEAIGGIAAIPPRIVTELLPGQSESYCIGFQNRGTGSIDLDVDAVDVAADEEGLPSSQREATDRGASRWVEMPTQKIVDLPPGGIAWLDVQVDVPDDALAGSSYASIIATDATPAERRTGTAVESIPSVAAQLFFDIPGDAARQGEVVDIRSPRVIWWDGFDLGDLPVLEKMRGLGVATVRFKWRNTGDFTSDIGGSVAITSDLSDKQVAELEVPQQVVLRDSERDYRVTWSRDIPLVGRFTPVLEVRGESGRVERHELDPIWVIPSWWYILAVILAIAVPLWMRRRSQRRYEELLARVEAAESQRDGEPGTESWDQDDEWDAGR